MPQTTGRCPWCGTDPLYVHYHDTVWGRPEYDNQALFEKLCLDGQQAGLSWITILRKQESYRQAYAGFDPEQIVRFDEDDIARLLADPGIIRNRLKVHSIIRNARGFLALRDQGISFSEFLWQFVDGRPIQNRWQALAEVPVTTPESEAMSKALKKAGFNFVGPTIVYAFMQATGMVNDHLVSCHTHTECRQLAQ
ncbi:MAG TPA: DNA-3-methyladenine glycosylase I [Marinobacter hydrocarbonoclasticus]|uniref:DNA-3-methyladenine glycosylase I n=1 Tax=Marinobacter TaxID=2742 RepID=UPI000C5BBDC6|nr:DNA-3-methyladenine glycosylase I [Marinobacter sp. UBA5687]MBH92240.1 DNA-3-methyladenine glycosylase I [Marinobacter sp.]HAX09764.1 DNA-3-methyladenine glycosylase I [Marinobacter nauticus]HCL39416.1 DNA-3-methyladenine glycosylase I [Marinobacter nauticus]|tara:strand:+ start:807 stop:1391 length:585 start_codon:yes stop_codon:yes gene_type:complete